MSIYLTSTRIYQALDQEEVKIEKYYGRTDMFAWRGIRGCLGRVRALHTEIVELSTDGVHRSQVYLRTVSYAKRVMKKAVREYDAMELRMLEAGKLEY